MRDVKDATVSTLAADVSTLATGLNGLRSRLLQIQEYLGLVLGGKLPVNHDIMYQLQVHCKYPHMCMYVICSVLSGKLPVSNDITALPSPDGHARDLPIALAPLSGC